MTPQEAAAGIIERALATIGPDGTPEERLQASLAELYRTAWDDAVEAAVEGAGRYLMVRTGLKVEKVVEVEAAIRSLKYQSAT